MSAGLVLALCLVLGAVLAMVASPILWAFAAILTRGRGSRQRLLLSAVALPWASLAWFLLVLVASSIADQAMGTDMGIGDDFFVSLPNGYRLSMIDALNHATLENPKHSSPAVNNVQRLEIHETLILGAAHEKRREDPEALLYSPEPIDGYFILDVGTNSVSKFQRTSTGAIDPN